jgi:hypothetical protein
VRHLAHLTAIKSRRAADSCRFSQEAGKGCVAPSGDDVKSGGGGGREKAAADVRPMSANLGQIGRFLSRAAREERGKAAARGEKRAVCCWPARNSGGPPVLGEAEALELEEEKEEEKVEKKEEGEWWAARKASLPSLGFRGPRSCCTAGGDSRV